MDNGRATALLKWINSVSGMNDVLFIRDFASLENANVLVKTLHLIDKDSIEVLSEDNAFTIEVILSCLLSYLEGFYHQSLGGIVDTELITVDADELEIGKLITLLLYAATQCGNVQHFIAGILELEEGVQYQIKDIIETVLKQIGHGGLDGTAITYLLKSTCPGKTKDTQEGPLFSPVASVASPVASVASPVQTTFSSSPFMALMSSPQMKSKQSQFAANKMHQKMSKLQMTLDAQAHVQSTLEDELADKNKQIENKDGKIKKLTKEVTQLKIAIDDLESTQHYRTDFEKLERDHERLKHQVAELEEFKGQSSDLEKRFAELLEDKMLFDKQVEDMDQLKAKCVRYMAELQHHEIEARELNEALTRRDVQIASIERERDEALKAATESLELWKSREAVSCDETSPVRFEGDGIPVEQCKAPNFDSRIIELEFANQRLRDKLASAVNPAEVQRLRDSLEETGKMKGLYEEKYVAAKSRILELEDCTRLMETQAKIREDGLKREIDDVTKSLESKEDDIVRTRKELSRARETNESLEMKIKDLQQQEATLSVRMDEMKQHTENLSREKHELEDAIASLKKQEATWLEENEQITKEVSSLKDGFVAEMKSNQEKLEHTSEALSHAKEANNICEKRIQDLQQQDEEKSRQMKQHAENLSREKQELEDAIGSLKNKEATWLEEKEEINKEVLSLKDGFASEMKSIQEQLEFSHDELSRAKEANKSCEKSIQDLQQQDEEKSREMNEVKQHTENLSREKQELEDAIASLKKKEAIWLEEKEEINMEVLSLKDGFAVEMKSNEEQLELSHEELTEAKLTNENLEKMIKELQQQQEEQCVRMEEMERNTETFSQNNEQLEDVIALLKKKEVTWLEEKELIGKEVSSLKDGFAAEMQSNQEQLGHTSEALSEAKLTNESLEKRIKDIQQQQEEQNARMEDMKRNTENLTKDKGELEDAIAALKKKETAWLEEREVIRMEVVSLNDAFASEMQSTKAKHDDSLAMLQKINEDTKQKLREQEQCVEELTGTCSQLKKNMDATEGKLLDITRERNKLEDELLAERQTGKKTKAELTSQLEQSTSKHTKEMRDVMDVLGKERKQHEKKRKDMEDELERACHGIKVAADKLEMLQDAKGESETQLMQEHASLRQLNQELESAKDNITARTKKQLILEEAYESDKAFWKSKLDAANEEMMKLTRELYEGSQKHSSELMDIQRHGQDKENRLESDKQSAQHEINQLQGKLASAEVSSRELQAKMKMTEASLLAVGEEKKILETSCKDLESKAKGYQENMEQMRTSVEEELTCIKEKQKKEMEEKEKEVETLSNTCNDLESKVNSSQEKMEQMKKSAEEEIERMKEQQKKEMGEKENEVEKLSSTCKDLESKVEAAQEKMEQVKKSVEEEIESVKESQKKEIEQKEKEVEKLSSEIKKLESGVAKVQEEKTAEVAKLEEITEKKIQEEIEKVKLQCEQEAEEKKQAEVARLVEAAEKRAAEKAEELANEAKDLKTKAELNEKSLKELEDTLQTVQEERDEAKKRLEDETAQMEEHMDVLKEENENLEEQIKEEQMICKRLGMQKNSLEAQVNHADKTIREQKAKLQEHQGNDTRKTKRIMIEVEKVVPMDNARDFLDDSTTTESDDSEMRRDDLGLSRQDSTVSFASTTSGISRSSLRSNTSGGRYARAQAARRQSAMYVKGDTPPTRRTTSAFFVTGEDFASNMEQENEYDFDWNRLAELERRNTICPPHLKTSYPVETQTRPVDEKNQTLHATRSETALTRKRKSEEQESARSKQQKGMAGSKSEGEIKRSKSKRLQHMVSSKISSLRSKSNEALNKERQTGGGAVFEISPPKKNTRSLNASNSEASAKRESMAFTIENSPPKKSGGVKRTRTINRSTASTQLIRDKDKEVCKKEIKQQIRNRIPLRQSNKKAKS